MSSYEIKVPYDWAERRKWLRLPFPEGEYRDRVARLVGLMEARGLEALLIYGQGLDANLRYLANLQSHGGESAMAVTSDGQSWISTTWLLHGEPMHSMVWESWVEEFVPAADGPELMRRAVDWLKDKAAGPRGGYVARIGLSGFGVMPVGAWDALRESLGGQPDICDDMMLTLRLTKSAKEAEYLRKACVISGAGIQAAMDAVQAGASEVEVASKAHAEMFLAGAETLAFGTAVVAGPRAGLKHANPSQRRMKAGELVFLDMGASYEGYNADLSRCVAVGDEVPRDALDMLQRAEDVFHDMIAAMKPGTAVAELARLYEDATRAYGYESEAMPAAFGHGVGVSLFERPLMGRGSPDVLQPGMAFAFEPMLVRYRFGTAVVEETILITETGAEILSGLPTRIYSV
ncbi:Xaa-Pro peptidase family protein [Aquisalimonas sp.]|uniref:M24 family metallopeptidase n=1 Tax=Aquisalimonas sp. TaxID=1872621 RepID=UPI0025BB88C6|nr:Xaa-Pro peptidase family protein [Aquisalimonas sp.]